MLERYQTAPAFDSGLQMTFGSKPIEMLTRMSRSKVAYLLPKKSSGHPGQPLPQVLPDCLGMKADFPERHALMTAPTRVRELYRLHSDGLSKQAIALKTTLRASFLSGHHFFPPLK